MRKYPHIINHYKNVEISKFADKYGKALKKEKYVIQEKIHGMNIRIRYLNGEITFGTRNTVKKAEDIRYLSELLPSIDEVIGIITNIDADEVIIFGELWGPKVQKEIRYSDKPFIKFFDMMIDGEMIPQKEFYELIPAKYRVPTYAFTRGLKKALKYKVDRLKSIINPSKTAEGVVIKPFDHVFKYYHSVFYIKKKHPTFIERKNNPQNRYRDIFNKKSEFHSPLTDYITKGRITSVIARNGGMNSKKDIGKFINLIIKDAAADYDKKYILTTTDRKVCGQIIAKKLLEMLKNENK